ncbi:Drop dead, partial [Operophtera brumata]
FNSINLLLSSRALTQQTLVPVFDATAKPPSGILSGNGNQYGDFDECLSIDGAVRGKYCLASLQVSLEDNFKTLDHMVHSGHYIRSNITDMGHRVPRYSSLLWGVCIPSSCSSFDLEEELNHRLFDIGISVRVHNTITFFLAVILLLSLGTLFDDGKEGATNFEKLLYAFSLKRNLKKMFDLSDAPSKVFGMPWAVVGRSAILYTDSFLYLSGFLNAHNLLQDLEKKGTIDMKDRFIARCLMLFCTYILPDLNNGPQWNLVVEEHSRVCEKNMWKSFLFIHNYFGFEEMCLTHTHQIGMDMQLYVATLPLMLVLWKFRTLGWTLLISITLLDAARYSYILPTHRATIYLIGVVMAYLMKTKKLNFNLNSLQVALLWTSAIALALFTMISPYKWGLEGYTYEHGPAAIFAAFSPIMVSDSFFNKIAYSVYLTQFPIFFYNVGVQRYSSYYSPFSLVNVPEILSVIGISIMTTVAIEMPFNQVYRIYFGKLLNIIKLLNV